MSFNLLHIWATMGFLSKVIAIILVLMAVISLSVVVERYLTLFFHSWNNKKFFKSLASLEDKTSDSLFNVCEQHKKSNISSIFNVVLNKYQQFPFEAVKKEAVKQKEIFSESIRSGMNILASIGSVAPFIGLLGTVVGIINAFKGIAETGSGGLSSVSAGISESLIETALGLMVAIPAVLFFNSLSSKIVATENKLSRQVDDLLDLLEYHGKH